MQFIILLMIAFLAAGGIWLARRRGRGWQRLAACRQCGQTAIQLLHGYNLDGTLYKGHVCMCRGWQCTLCHFLNQPRRSCCR